MINWHSLLYFGEGIKEEYDHIKKALEGNEAPGNIYIISLSDNPIEQLDITSAFMFIKNMKLHPDPVIVGIAIGRKAAEGIVAQMAFDVYSVTGSVDFRKYFAEHEASKSDETEEHKASESEETFDEQ